MILRTMLTLRTLSACLGYIALTACATSPEPNYFLLRTPASETAVIEDYGGAILVQSVTLPDHMRRQEIVFEPDGNSVTLSGLDRWAEPLDRNIADVLTTQIGNRFGSENVFDNRAGFVSSPATIVRIDISEFLLSGDAAAITATWEISGAARSETARFNYSSRTQVSGTNTADRVSAMEVTLANLGRAIADSLAESSQ